MSRVSDRRIPHQPPALWGAVLMLWACLIGTGAAGAGTSWKVVNPKASSGVVKIRTAGKALPYHVLTSDHPLEVELEGPANLRAVTRLQFDSQAADEARYAIRVVIDSTDRRTYRKTVRKSLLSALIRGRGQTSGKIRTVSLYAPEGVHTYRVETLPGSAQSVLMRFLVQETRAKRQWAYLNPKAFSSLTVLEVKGEERTYFPVTRENSLTLEATGPVQLKLLARWQSLEPARRSAEAQLQIFQDGALHSTRLVRSGRATGEAVPIEELSVVGAARRIVLDVPSGKHLYTFRLVESPGVSAVLVRPFIRVGRRGDGQAQGETTGRAT